MADNPVTAGLMTSLKAAGQATPVLSWTDSSPAGTGTATPLSGFGPATRIDNATPAGGPAIHFSENAYSVGNVAEFDTATSAEFFAVIRDNGTQSSDGFYQLGGESRMTYAPGGTISDQSFTNTTYTFPAVTPSQWHIYNVTHDGTTRTTRIDGQVVHTATIGFTPPRASSYDLFRVSRYGWLGDIAEMAVYKRSLTTTERAQVYDYLRTTHLAGPALLMPPVAVLVTATTAGTTGGQAGVTALTLPPIAVAVALSLTEGGTAPKLILDLAAATLGDVDGSTVNTWANTPAGGLGNAVLTSGTAATYRRAGTPNGGPVVRFADAQYTLQNTAALDTSTSAELFAVVRTDGSTGNGPGFFQFGGSDYTYYTFGDGNLYDGSFTNTRYSFAFSTPSDWHVYNVSHDGTTRTTRIDGQVVHTATIGFTAPSRSTLPVCLLGRQYTNYPWHGDIAEILTYDRSLSTTQRDQVYASLRATHFDARTTTAAIVCPPIPVVVTAVPGLRSDPVPVLLMPALAVQIAAPAATAAEPVTVLLPPVAVTAAAGAPTDTGASTALACSPADIGVDALTPVTVTGTAVPLAPVAVVVPGARPVFTVTVTNDTPGLRVQVQFSADPAFTTGAADVFTDAPAGLVGATATVPAAQDVPAGVLWWRARLTGAYGPGPWSPAVQFALNPIEGQAVAAGDLEVLTSGLVAPPHLWFIDTTDTGTQPGDQAYLAGTGFGPNPAVMLGAVACTVDEVADLPATGPAGERQITTGGDVTTYHQRVAFTIPAELDADHVGDALTVQKG